MFEIWTDGGCHGNPGPGGWAYLIIERDEADKRQVIAEQWGAAQNTTNNRMELSAVIAALEAVSEYTAQTVSPLTVVTDSEYVKNGITVWIHDWKIRGWRTAAKKPVKNQDLWQRLDVLASALSLRWQWVRGHSGHEFNERCDMLTQKAIESLPR